MIYLENNVFDEALERIRFVFDNHDDIIVGFSGGKDSTVLFHLALIVAKEKNRLPLKVFFLDQEAEWQGTIDHVNEIMHMPEVKPYWFQVPMDFPNCLSNSQYRFLCWDDRQKDLWIHPKSDIAIQKNPMGDRLDYTFYDLIGGLKNYCTDSDNCAALVGMRMLESIRRRFAITLGKAKYKGITWCQTKHKGDKFQVFWPIYDWTNADIWTAIAKNHWSYNKVYDKQYQKGVSPFRMRISALIHETAWNAIDDLQEFEPETYNRFCRRVAGTNAMSHAFDYSEVVPKELPFAFRDWKEYRDYLLEHIVKPEYRETFRKRWAKQEGEAWYRLHVKECILNDIDGTINESQATTLRKQATISEHGKHTERMKSELEAYLNDKRSAD